MQKAKRGDTVLVHYTGSFEDGSVFDTSEDGDPLEFTIGSEQVIAGFEEAIVGMKVGDRKREVISAERGYGKHEEQMVFQVGRDQLPDGTDVEVGETLQISFTDGETTAVQVMVIAEDSLTLDANHPMAGKTLVFELELIGIS
ncbi:MAG: FKBP-type peptidyl-prolyl cis-trans isomerase [Thermoanaerobaculia bacterium]|nr:FKBP-type peptidyl-prolyl cis-trans isomerase [Thermoanaerobaculia bacterium]